MHNPIIPKQTNTKETISNPNIINGCFTTNLALKVIASIALISEKMISGIVRKVRKDTMMVISIPMNFIPK